MIKHAKLLNKVLILLTKAIFALQMWDAQKLTLKWH